MEVQVGPLALNGPSLLVRSDRVENEWLQVPDPIIATVVDGEWLIRLRVCIDQEHKVPRIDEVTISRKPGGPYVDPEMIRYAKLGEASRIAVEKATTRWTERDGVMSHTSDTPAVTRRDTNAVYRREQRDRLLHDVVEAYLDLRGAERDAGQELHQAIAARVGTSRATVGRRLRQARQLGLLVEGQRGPLRTTTAPMES